MLQQDFESDAWNMSKAVAKKKKREEKYQRERETIPALKYVHGVEF